MKWIILFSWLLLCNGAAAQAPVLDSTAQGISSSPVVRSIHTYDPKSQRLLLELGFTYFNAARQNLIGLDSALKFASRLQGLPRMLVVGEAFPQTLTKEQTDWFEAQHPARGLQLLKAADAPGRIPLLILLGAYYVFEYNGFDRYKDSIQYFLKEAMMESERLHEDAWTRQAQCLLMKMYAEAGDRRSSDSSFNALLRACQQAKDKPMEAKAWLWRGIYTAFYFPTIPDRIDWFETAALLYRSLGDLQSVVNVEQDIGYNLIAATKIKESADVYNRAKALEDSIGFPFTYYTVNMLCFEQTLMGEFAQPLQLMMTDIQTAQASGDSTILPILYGNLAGHYAVVERYHSFAIKWYQAAINQWLRMGADPCMYGNLSGLVVELVRAGKTQEALKDVNYLVTNFPVTNLGDQRDYHLSLLSCYMSLKDYTKADAEVRKVDPIINNPKLDLGEFSVGGYFAQKGDLLFLEKKSDSSRYYLNLALKSVSRVPLDNEVMHYIYADLFTLDSLQGHYADAIRNLEAAQQVTRDEFTIQSEREQEELNLQYQTAQREKELLQEHQQIKSLKDQDKLRQANLKQANLIRNITIGAIVLLLCVGALLYRQYQQRQKTARLILRKNKLLENLLTEKEWLIKEIHHRVKNNLHTVICLLESQAKHLENDALKAIEVSQNRIYAMSLLHQKIYQSADVRTIDMAAYIPEFVGYLYQSFGSPSHIRFDLDIDRIRMDIAKAIPVALIINEAVTNALKYAFPYGQSGLIYVGLHEKTEVVSLIVSDNGIGIGVTHETSESGSLGLELMEGLTQELRGLMSIEVQGGTLITITIPTTIFEQSGLEVIQDQTPKRTLV